MISDGEKSDRSGCMRVAFTEIRNHRCEICYMHKGDCICAIAPAVHPRSPISLVMHVSEVFKTTSTARLIPLSIPSARVQIRGLSKGFTHPYLDYLAKRGRDEAMIFTGTYQKLALFPSREALDIGEFKDEWNQGKLELLIPDGNWNQASRMVHREKIFEGSIPVRLNSKSKGNYLFRTQVEDGRFSTFESLIRSLEILEGGDAILPLWDFLGEMHGRYVRTRNRPGSVKER